MQLFFFRLTYVLDQILIFIFCGSVITILCSYKLLIELEFIILFTV